MNTSSILRQTVVTMCFSPTSQINSARCRPTIPSFEFSKMTPVQNARVLFNAIPQGKFFANPARVAKLKPHANFRLPWSWNDNLWYISYHRPRERASDGRVLGQNLVPIHRPVYASSYGSKSAWQSYEGISSRPAVSPLTLANRCLLSLYTLSGWFRMVLVKSSARIQKQ